jgi:hypothetical protein
VVSYRKKGDHMKVIANANSPFAEEPVIQEWDLPPLKFEVLPNLKDWSTARPPNAPGIYAFYLKPDEVLYIGSSLSLQRRFYMHTSTPWYLYAFSSKRKWPTFAWLEVPLEELAETEGKAVADHTPLLNKRMPKLRELDGRRTSGEVQSLRERVLAALKEGPKTRKDLSHLGAYRFVDNTITHLRTAGLITSPARGVWKAL